MRAVAFTNVYNEAPLIAYWVRCYRAFCERVVVFVDTETTDGTAEIALREGADVRAFDGGGAGLDDQLFAAHASSAYRECVGQTDWCIWTDCDELLWSPNMPERLDQLKEAGITLPHTRYYVMSSPGLPVHEGQLWDQPEFRRGLFVQDDAKLCLFDPNQLAIQWAVGKHSAYIDGPVRRDDGADPIKMLHYRWLGEDYLHQRDAKNFTRLSERSRALGFGTHVRPGFVGPYDSRWPESGPADAQDMLS